MSVNMTVGLSRAITSTPALGELRFARATSALSKTSGFIAEAGFTHSLTPARNCTYGCLYCYVPTLRIHGGLRKEDWQQWGQFTTIKENLPELLGKQLRPDQRIYCSPLTDPYQPAEREARLMLGVLRELIVAPPAVFSIQTRGPLILRDLDLLGKLAERTVLRISFSVTTNRDDMRRIFEPHCETIAERLDAIKELSQASLRVHATLAPLLPCEPEELADQALEVTNEALIIDPLHIRQSKARGATTRDAAHRLCAVKGFEEWLEPAFQRRIVERIQQRAARQGRQCGAGVEGFAWLAKTAT
jgi:DNA repair photolyase